MTDQSPPLPEFDWPEFPKGLVWMAGAGPGSPGLLTLEVLHALRLADTIVYDALVDKRILAWANSDATLLFVGKRGGTASPKQREISLSLIELARGGARVLRLKGGDPFVFGRGGEEAQALVNAGIPIRVSPGITAGIGGLAAAGIPLTHRDVGQTVTFLTGHDQKGEAPSTVDWDALARSSHTIVIYMGMRQLPKITDRLLGAGRSADEPVAIVSNATLPDMSVLESTLAEVAQAAADAGVGAPSLVCIGKNVALRQTLDWASQLAGHPPRDLDPLGTFNSAGAP